MRPIQKLLIANRGEVVSRIIRTCRDMGIATVAVYSDADTGAPFVDDADEAFRIGPAASAESYLSIPNIIDAAVRAGADAIHPGYGFLAENPEFAQACIDRGLVFVGPPVDAIRRLGSKRTARWLATAAGVPVLPSWDDPAEVELPVVLKASAGGGGKGMRIVRSRGDLLPAIESVRREAMSAFGDDTLLIERYIDRPRHIEIQILGDSQGNLVHLFERECTIQRRHQKVIEEAPSPVVDDELREKLAAAALALARSVDYQSAGTVEFLLAPDGQFYFLEVNTRLQVEHLVTEMVANVDIVREQIRVAEGEPLGISQSDLSLTGCAIQARVYAEDAASGYVPSTGTLCAWHFPHSWARIETSVEAGSAVGIHYDPMLAKVICHEPTRADALKSLASVLSQSVVFGVVTNRELLVNVLRHPEFRAGRFDTHFLEDRAGELVPPPPTAEAIERAVFAVTLADHERRRTERTVLPGLEPGYRSNRFSDEEVSYRVADSEVTARYRNLGGGRFRCVLGERAACEIRIAGLTDDDIAIEYQDGRRTRIPIARDDRRRFALVDGHTISAVEIPRFPERAEAAIEGACTAPIPGKVSKLCVSSGSAVSRGDILVVLEAMKMEHPVKSPRDGVITELLVGEGDQVDAEDVLVVVKAVG